MTENTHNKSFGQRVKTTRQVLNMSQEDLANKLGVTPQHISAVELDKRVPSLNFLSQLAKQLGVTTDYLIVGELGKNIDSVNAIIADNSLSDEAKKALTIMVKVLRKT